jgi:hypothetical protein
MAIDPNAGFQQLVKAWQLANGPRTDVLTEGQGFWHAANTLDAYITYLVAAKQRVADDVWSDALRIFNNFAGTPQSPKWWRDDYGWWGIAFLNAAPNAEALGIDASICIENADRCWQIMNYDWVHNRNADAPDKPLGVRNNPSKQTPGVANTITNVLFLMLGIRRYETSDPKNRDKDSLATAGAVFDWFYPSEADKSRLLNDDGLVRETPGVSDNRAWSADQGWFWRVCLTLEEYDATRKDKIDSLFPTLGDKILANVFNNKVAHELPDPRNFDINYVTGPGVFMRQFVFINSFKANIWSDLIQQTAQGASDYSGWQQDWTTIKPGCWHDGPCEYEPLRNKTFALWDLTRKTSAQDAFNAFMTTV